MKSSGGLDKNLHLYWISVIDQGTDYNKSTKGQLLEETR
jgi:hypothetical protein